MNTNASEPSPAPNQLTDISKSCLAKGKVTSVVDLHLLRASLDAFQARLLGGAHAARLQLHQDRVQELVEFDLDRRSRLQHLLVRHAAEDRVLPRV